MKHSILVAVLYLWALPNPAATYFISPTGNDSNAGTSARTIAQTNAVTGCSGDNIYGLEVSQSNSTNVVDADWIAGLDGNNTLLYASGTFAYGSANVLGTSPNFANPTVPWAPSCGGAANVPACMEA
jgi:acid phosphatase class B